MDYRRAFRSAAVSFADLIARVPADRWDDPALGDWSLRELAGHATSSGLRQVPAVLDTPAEEIGRASSEDYWLLARAVPPGGLRAFLHRTATSGIDALVVDARTLITPDAVAELRRAADLDPMIVATLPRFSVQAMAMSRHRPALDYVLRPDGRCAYIKASALGALGEAPFWVPAAGRRHEQPVSRRFGNRQRRAETAWHPAGNLRRTSRENPKAPLRT